MNPLSTIYQTPEWFELQAMFEERGTHHTIEYPELGVMAEVEHRELPYGQHYLYLNRGPVTSLAPTYLAEHYDFVLGEVEKFSQKPVLLRLDPPVTDQAPEAFDALKAWLRSHGFNKVASHQQPETTVILNLSHTEDELLSAMKQKCRYNIKVAQKHEVEIRKTTDNVEELKKFYELLKGTADRDGFSIHEYAYYKKMFDVFDDAVLYSAYHDEQYLAGTLNMNFNKTATYYYGASDYEYRKFMAPYLLQWTAIRDAKQAGMHSYDFLGIAPEGSSGHSWAGVTRFKTQWGGDIVNYVGTWEKSYKPLWAFGMKAKQWVNKRK